MKRLAILKNGTLVSVTFYRDDTSAEERAALVSAVEGDNSIIIEEKQEIRDDGTVYENLQPYPSWIWVSEGRKWIAPKDQPVGDYEWNESILDWELWSAS